MLSVDPSVLCRVPVPGVGTVTFEHDVKKSNAISIIVGFVENVTSLRGRYAYGASSGLAHVATLQWAAGRNDSRGHAQTRRHAACRGEATVTNYKTGSREGTRPRALRTSAACY